MRNISIRTLGFAAITALVGFTGCSTIQADPALVITIGEQAPPPPPRQQYSQWAKPSRSAVWIPGHNEWTRERGYFWVGGYYSYPPQGNRHWVGPQYTHHHNGYRYQPGHWGN